ncbi:MAG: hypothetical protein HRF43_06315 [Phycisphaerae bacterium]|jgi:hypothetical protein
MKSLSLLIVGLSLAVAAGVMVRESRLTGPASVPLASAVQVRVTGAGNTLAALAAAPENAGLISYDPATRTATSRATLVVEGELVLGRENEPASGETLQFDTQSCGDMRLEVRPGGLLRVYHSTLQTVSQVLSAGACSRGYGFFCDGELVMKDSRVRYISGSASECLRGQARATIHRSVFSYCDGSALSCVEVDGGRIDIDGCDFRGSGNWGLVVEGRGGEPLVIRNCLLDARVGALFVSGRSAVVRLVDCVFDPAKLVFNQDSGEVQIAWTRRVQVVDARTGAPVPGAMVRVETGSPRAAEPVETRADPQGRASLVLLERIARPGRRDAGATLEHRFRVKRPDGEWTPCPDPLVARGKDDQPVILPAS